ncbi:MAG: hypothetical protein FJ308_04035 [Planctomycetes bacterium]|nr:hypothetical protein [Planctomycetota bacterium]
MAISNEETNKGLNRDAVGSCRKQKQRLIIRSAVMLAVVLIAIDTAPSNLTFMQPIKSYVFPTLGALGLAQGDWPLFAPDPVLKNGNIIAEVSDGNHQQGTWSSPDWARATPWEKFYRFRHMNYYQRVGLNHYAASDLADYLSRAIPSQEHAIPAMRWSDSNELIPGEPLVSPILDLKLYQYQQRMVLSKEKPMPTQSETIWSNQNRFLLRREYPK